ncbi:MAG: hypothetical protein ACE15C_21500 [Phycisphaerae bacterium]
MPLTLTEKLDSRKWNTGDNASVEMVYILTGTSDDLTAKMLIENSTAETYNGLTRQSINLEPEWVDTTRSDGQWVATVRYGVKPPAEVGESSFSFDTGGGTQHVTQSISTINRYAPAGKTAPDFKGAVGVTHDNVEGVDITVPVYAFSETHYLPDSVVTPAYKGTLFSLTGKVNNASFKGCAAGECLFLGASGSKRGADDWEISYRFAASPNRTGITVGDIAGISKKGWEYMWVRYADSEDVAAKAIVKKPVAVYIEKVYEEGNLAGLGIGT